AVVRIVPVDIPACDLSDGIDSVDVGALVSLRARPRDVKRNDVLTPLWPCLRPCGGNKTEEPNQHQNTDPFHNSPPGNTPALICWPYGTGAWDSPQRVLRSG